MQHATNDKRAFTEKEAASYLSMSRSYLRQARMEGNRDNRTPAPKFIKIGSRAVRYLKEDLDNWLESFTRLQSTTESSRYSSR